VQPKKKLWTMQFILEFFSRYWHYNNQLANLSHMYWRSAWGVGGELYTEVPSLVFLATKFCIVVIFFFKMNIISCCLKKTFIRNEIFWATFIRCLFLAVVDKQIIYFIFERF
jgi:hypothetical protein